MGVFFIRQLFDKYLIIIYPTIMKQLLQQPTMIATRDFLRDFSALSEQSVRKSYIITKHGKPLWKVVPVDDGWWEGLAEQIPADEPKKGLTLEQFRKKYSFRSGEKHLSQRIDEIVYGIKRS